VHVGDPASLWEESGFDQRFARTFIGFETNSNQVLTEKRGRLCNQRGGPPLVPPLAQPRDWALVIASPRPAVRQRRAAQWIAGRARLIDRSGNEYLADQASPRVRWTPAQFRSWSSPTRRPSAEARPRTCVQFAESGMRIRGGDWPLTKGPLHFPGCERHRRIVPQRPGLFHPPRATAGPADRSPTRRSHGGGYSITTGGKFRRTAAQTCRPCLNGDRYPWRCLGW